MDCDRGDEGMRIAAIDIGTNAVLLLIADIDHNGLTTIHHEQRLPRLGRHVDQRGEIHPSAFDQIGWIINEYKNLSQQMKVEKIAAVATSAVRDAANREEFLSYIERNTGIAVEVLSGDEEALSMYLGALSGFQDISSQCAVIDIGGGSTEISYPTPRRFNGDPALRWYSFQMGAVRITERFFKESPPTQAEIHSARQYILEEISQVQNPGFDVYELIGVAGTVTTLACLDQQLMQFDVHKVRGYTMDRQRIDGWFSKLSALSAAEIRSLSEVTIGREDILTAGVLILQEAMTVLGFRQVRVSERGLRYGVIMREWEKGSS